MMEPVIGMGVTCLVGLTNKFNSTNEKKDENFEFKLR